MKNFGLVILALICILFTFSISHVSLSDPDALHTDETYTYGDPVIMRGVTREHSANGTYEEAYAYGCVGEIIGLAADWYSYASVSCEPSDPNYESSYKLKVELLRSGIFRNLQFNTDTDGDLRAGCIAGVYKTIGDDAGFNGKVLQHLIRLNLCSCIYRHHHKIETFQI